MTALALGFTVAGIALVSAWGVVWARWRVRDRRRRRARIVERNRQKNQAVDE